MTTAAHCFPQGKKTKAKDVFVRVHMHDLYPDADDEIHECSTAIQVKDYVQHPKYDKEFGTIGDAASNDFDAALLFLKEVPPCIADGTGRTEMIYLDPIDPAVGSKMRVNGWGATNKQATKFPDEMHEVSVDVMSLKECREHKSTITDNMLCAQAPGKDACLGDSGGPLAYDKDGKTWQTGITSSGPIPCADMENPGVWTRVSKIVDWVGKYVPPPTNPPTISPAPTSTDAPLTAMSPP